MFRFDQLKRGMILYCVCPRGYTSNIVRVDRINKRSVRMQHLLDSFALPQPPKVGFPEEHFRVTWTEREISATLGRWWSVRPEKAWDKHLPGFRQKYKGLWLLGAKKRLKGKAQK